MADVSVGCSEREEPVKGNISIAKTNGDFVLMSTVSLFKFGSLDFTIYYKRHENILEISKAPPRPLLLTPAVYQASTLRSSSDDMSCALWQAAQTLFDGTVHVTMS